MQHFMLDKNFFFINWFQSRIKVKNTAFIHNSFTFHQGLFSALLIDNFLIFYKFSLKCHVFWWAVALTVKSNDGKRWKKYAHWFQLDSERIFVIFYLKKQKFASRCSQESHFSQFIKRTNSGFHTMCRNDFKAF